MSTPIEPRMSAHPQTECIAYHVAKQATAPPPRITQKGSLLSRSNSLVIPHTSFCNKNLTWASTSRRTNDATCLQEVNDLGRMIVADSHLTLKM